MIYVKIKKEDFGDSIETTNDGINVDIYGDEFYSTCPYCQKESKVDFEELKQILNTEGDFASTSIFCNECSKRVRKKEIEVI